MRASSSPEEKGFTTFALELNPDDPGTLPSFQRFRDEVMAQNVTWSSLFLGHGLGAAVGERTRIEESYLEILHQQGLLGLVFWFAILALLARDYMRALQRGREAMALPFLLGAMFVYIESATNPFLTNPIGMSMVLIALVALKLIGSAPTDLQAAASGHHSPAESR